MAKEVTGFIKLQIKGGAANPAPPVGPALGSKGLNIMDFCKQFNARTQDQAGKVLPVVITVYSDKSFSFEVKQPPVAVSLKEAAKISSGSGEPNRKKVASVTWDQVKEIAQSRPGQGDRPVQDARPQLLHPPLRDVHGGRYGPQHGYQGGRRIPREPLIPRTNHEQVDQESESRSCQV